MSFLRTILILGLSWLTVSAQQPPVPTPLPRVTPPAPTTPGATNPSTAPAAPAVPAPAVPAPAGATTAPAAGAINALPEGKLPEIKPGIPLGENTIEEDIVEPKLSGNALAALYRRYTGRRVIVSSAASAAEFSFVQEASPKDPLTFAQAAELLKKAAILENFVFVPHPNDPKLDVLTLATGGTRPTGIGIGTFKDDDQLPEGDAVITYVMTLSYLKPAEAVNTFTQIIGQFGAFGSIAAAPNASAIVITENTSLIRKLIDLKKEIDKPSTEVASRFIKVQYADVSEIAQTLTTLLTTQQSAQKTAGVQRTPAAPAAPNPAAAAMPGGDGGASEDNPPQIVPEPRTNRIFVMGRPVDILFVEGLIREFDIPTTEKTFLRRKLRFLTVSDFLPIAGDALTRAFTGTGEGGASPTAGSPQGGTQGGGARNNQTTSRTQSSNRSSTSSRTSSNGSFGSGNSSFGGMGNSYGSMGGGSMGGGSSLNDPAISSAPESLLVGRTLLVADNITNTIVAQGPPPALDIIERLLDQIDVKPDQIMISTVIGQLTLDNTHETGVNYLFNGTDGIGGGGGGFPIIPLATTATTRFPEFDAQSLAGSGLRAYGKFGDMGVFLKALQSKTDFTVLSRPSIFTSNNQKGTISSGERIAIPTGSNTYNSGGGGTQIQYQDVVLKLEVIPLVNDNKTVTMQIAMLNDEQNGTQTIAGGGSNGSDLTVPKISTREILTTATVPNNQTIVLGGLIVSKDDKNKSGIPILSDIPYLGKLFSNDKTTKNRSELMVFIQPTIVNSDRSRDDVQNAMDNRYNVSSKVRNFADGPGVLPNVDEIPRVESGGKNGSSHSQSTAPAPSSKPAKKSMLPVFRR